MSSSSLRKLIDALVNFVPDGCLIQPSDTEFDAARLVYNRMHDCRPAAIVRSLDPLVLHLAVSAALDNGVPVAIRGGGHHIGGFSTIEGGLLIDLSCFRGVRFEPHSKIAYVQPGARLGDLDCALELHDRCVPAGTVSDTGVTGLTLGGGIGWLVTQYGLTCDHLHSVLILLTNGRVIVASNHEHEDLFFAIRGGGVGAFGIVLELRFNTIRLPEIMAGSILFEYSDIPGVLRKLQQIHRDDPLVATSIAPTVMLRDGEAVLSVDLCCVIAKGAAELERIRDRIGGNWSDVCNREYSDWQANFDEQFMPPKRGYWKSVHFDLSRIDAECVLASILDAPSDGCSVLIELYNPDTLRAHEEGSAYPLRNSWMGVLLTARWDSKNDDKKHILWARKWASALRPGGENKAYSNYSAADDGGIKLTYESETLKLFDDLERKYDPFSVHKRGHRTAFVTNDAKTQLLKTAATLCPGSFSLLGDSSETLRTYARKLYSNNSVLCSSLAEQSRSIFAETLRKYAYTSSAAHEFLTNPVIQTGSHHRLAFDDDFCSTLALSIVGTAAAGRKVNLMFNCATVTLEERSHRGPGWLRVNENPTRVFDIPRRTLSKKSVIAFDDLVHISPNLVEWANSLSQQGINIDVTQTIALSARDQITRINNQFYRQLRKGTGVESIVLHEKFFAEMLANTLERPSLLRRLIEDGRMLTIVQRLGIAAADKTTSFVPNSTDLFWVLINGRIRPLQLIENQLCSEKYDMKIPFEVSSLTHLLRTGVLVPNLFLIFCMASILPAARALGGAYQASYYEVFRQIILDTLDLGAQDERELFEEVCGRVLVGWGHNVIAHNAMDDLVVSETDTLTFSDQLGDTSLKVVSADFAAFSTDERWQRLHSALRLEDLNSEFKVGLPNFDKPITSKIGI